MHACVSQGLHLIFIDLERQTLFVVQVWWRHRCRSPPPSSPPTAPSAPWPGRLLGRTGRCSRRSSSPAPLGRPRCSTAKSRGTTCWTGGRARTSRTCPSSLGPCSYLWRRKRGALVIRLSSSFHGRTDFPLCFSDFSNQILHIFYVLIYIIWLKLLELSFFKLHEQVNSLWSQVILQYLSLRQVRYLCSHRVKLFTNS